MAETKRTRVRAIIIENNQLLLMYREKDNSVFYTFPGGGAEKNETDQECIIREVKEEFGILIKPIKKVYTYENKYSIEHFYLSEWVSGEFGTGTGEEFDSNQKNGLYKPMKINISDIPNLPLMPPEIATSFYEDYMLNGINLRNDVKFFI